jgi:hypothetical protein
MTEFGPEPTFRTYLQILRHRKWRDGSITAFGLAARLGFSLTAHKEYPAAAQFLVQPSVNASGLDPVQQAVWPAGERPGGVREAVDTGGYGVLPQQGAGNPCSAPEREPSAGSQPAVNSVAG